MVKATSCSSDGSMVEKGSRCPYAIVPSLTSSEGHEILADTYKKWIFILPNSLLMVLLNGEPWIYHGLLHGEE